MSSPAKKRKLNNAAKPEKPQSKGLEYFFSKQKQNGGSSSAAPESSPADADSATLTDEELARKLQAEWDKEATQVNNQQPTDAKESAEDAKVQTDELATVEEQHPDALKQPSDALKQPLDALKQATPASIFGGKRTLALQSTGMDEDSITISIPLDEPPLTFEPSKYIDQLKAHWSRDGGNASYALLTRCFVLVSGTTSRIKIVDTLVNCLRLLIEGDPDSLLPAVCTVCPKRLPCFLI